MILLDANVLVWWACGDPRLGPHAREKLEAPHSRLTVSLLTLFEIELKIQAGKLRLPSPMYTFLEHFAIQVYTPTSEELATITGFHLQHRDPFDRTLMGLAKLKGWDLMTSDTQLHDIRLPHSTVIDSRQ